MARRRSALSQWRLEVAEKLPVNTTVTLPWDFLQRINAVCERTGAFKYELLAAALYDFMRRHNLIEVDEGLEPYLQKVEEMVRFAQRQEAD